MRDWLLPKPSGMGRIAHFAQRHGVTVDQLKGPQRFKKLAHLRQDLYRELYDTGLYSMPQIGALLGNRDHTTVLHGIRKARERAQENG